MYFPRPLIFAFLIGVATLFASNHIAARTAFDDGAGLVLALVARTAMACFLMALMAIVTRQSFKVPKEDRRNVLWLGVFISIQSFTLYSAVARLPVAVALLLVNAWPMLFIFMGWVTGRTPFRWLMLFFLSLIAIGLSFVLQIPALFGGQYEFGEQWWAGIFFGVTSAVFLGLAMWITNYHMAHMSGSVRSFYTMVIVLVNLNVLGLSGLLPGSYDLPQTSTGVIAMLLLATFYGLGSTMLFAFAPKLDMARNSPALNFEPVASLALGVIFLQQYLSVLQLVGGALVVLSIVFIGILK